MNKSRYLFKLIMQSAKNEIIFFKANIFMNLSDYGCNISKNAIFKFYLFSIYLYHYYHLTRLTRQCPKIYYILYLYYAGYYSLLYYS